MTFWNVAGMKNKDPDFWGDLKGWDIIFLLETWLDERGWEKARGKLPKEFIWDCQFAGRINRKGRAMGGIVVGIKRGITVEKHREGEREGIMEKVVRLGKDRWRMAGVYVRGDMEEKLGVMRSWMEKEGVRTLIGGDFNARTGRLGGRVGEEEEEEGRMSKDEKVNGEGRLLVRRLEEVGWSIFNGGVEGDLEGNWTYVGAGGQSVMDYAIGNDEVRELIKRLEIGCRL